MKKLGAFIIGMLLIFSIMGMFYPVKGEGQCTPENPCYITQCTMITQSGYYKLANDIVVNDVSQFIPVHAGEDENGLQTYAGKSCVAIYEDYVIIDGNGKKILLNIPMEERPSKVLSAVYVDHEQAEFLIEIKSLVMDGWDVGVDTGINRLRYTVEEIMNPSLEVVGVDHYVTFSIITSQSKTNFLLYNNTIRNTIIGIALSGYIVSDPSFPLKAGIQSSNLKPLLPVLPRFSGFLENTFEDNIVSVHLSGMAAWSNETTPFLMANNTVRKSYMGVVIHTAIPAVKEFGAFDYLHKSKGPTLVNNEIVNNTQGLTIVASKKVGLINNSVKNNRFGIIIRGEKNLSKVLSEGGEQNGILNCGLDCLSEYWIGITSNVTISGNEITNNTWGIAISTAENLTISGNLIADNRDTYEEVPYTLPNGKEVEAYAVPSFPLYGIGLYLHNVSNSLIENNELFGNGIGPISPEYFPFCDSCEYIDNMARNHAPLGYIGALIDIEGENNTIKGNYIHDNAGIGIYLRSRDELEKNVLVNDYISTIGTDGYFTDFEVKETTVSGRPVLMVKNAKDVLINNAGQVFVVNSSNVRIEGLEFQSYKATPVIVSGSSDVEIRAVNAKELEGIAGIYVQDSSGVRITESSFERNYYASIGVKDSKDVLIEGNRFSENFGIPVLASGVEGLDIRNNEMSSSGGGVVALNIENGRIADNRVHDAVMRKRLLGWSGEYQYDPLFGYYFYATPVFERPYPWLPGIEVGYSPIATIVVNGTGLEITSNEILENELAGIHVWNGKNIEITSNGVENNSRGGVILGLPVRTGNSIRVEEVIVRENTFVNNGLSITGDYGSTLIDRLLIPEVPLVRNIRVEDNTVNGRPLVYLENEEGVEISNAGQVIAVNSTFTVKGLDVPFADLPLLAIDSRVTIEDSSFQGRWGVAILRSNASIKNTRVEHGAEWVYYSYQDPVSEKIVNGSTPLLSFGFHLVYSNATLLDVDVVSKVESNSSMTGIDVYAEPTRLYSPVSVKISGAKVENELTGIDVTAQDVEIMYSEIENSHTAINVKAYGKATIEGNRISNAIWGLCISPSRHGQVIIAENIIHNVEEAGINIGGKDDLSNFNVTGNEVRNSKYGLLVTVPYQSMGNGVISNNLFAENYYGLILGARTMENVEVHTNWLVNNTYGLTINAEKSEEVTVYNNYFDNYRDVYISHTLGGVSFNTTVMPGRNIVGGPLIGGNYWERYDGTDENFDGIGDEPYQIAYGTYDYLPLIKFKPKSIGGEFPIIINEPGYYRLETDGENLSMEYAVLINSNNVLLDGGNHTLSGKELALYGVKVESVENVTVVNLNLKGWLLAGIYAENTLNARISGNTVTGNTAEGIDIRNSRGAEVSYNTIKDLTGDGVYLKDTVNSSISHNTVENAKGSGMELDTGSAGNLVWGNSISSSGVGIYLRPGSKSNVIFSNLVINNSLGVYVSNSKFNLIYNNYFDNARNVKVLGNVTNHWNVTKREGKNILGGNLLGGNYWSELKDCEDKNLDGFCDVPYVIDDNNVDYLPLTVSSDTKPPEVEIIFPENTTYYQNVTEIKVRASDDHVVEKVMALVDGSTWITLEFDGEYYTAKITLEEGHHAIEVYAYDAAGNVNLTRLEFTVEIKEIKTSIEDQETAQLSFAILTYLYYQWYQKAFEEFNVLYNSSAQNLDNETLVRIKDFLALAKKEYRWVEGHYHSLLQADIGALIHMRKAYSLH
ncbi:NosD domain-containing protein [Thermococcus barophilus]|nr:NosD domain-containing protein [Thermococcus barophilus]